MAETAGHLREPRPNGAGAAEERLRMGLCLSSVDKAYEVYSGVQRAEKVPLPSWLGLHSLDKGSSIDRFSDLTYIARDRDCEIFAGRHSSGKRWYALRRYHKQRVYEKKLLPSIQHEIDVFLNLDGLRGFATTVFNVNQDANHLYLIGPYHPGGDLVNLVKKRGPLPEEAVRFYAAELAVALNLMHSEHEMVFGDLQPRNVVIDYDGHLKFLNVGGARESTWNSATQRMAKLSVKKAEFSTDYAAPEMFRGDKYDEAADWWSYGCVLFFLMSGKAPYDSTKYESVSLVTSNILDGDRERMPPRASGDFRDLVINLLRSIPERRIGFGQLQRHPFFAKVNWAALAERKVQPPFIPNLRWAGEVGYYEPPSPHKEQGELPSFSPAIIYADPNALKINRPLARSGSKGSMRGRFGSGGKGESPTPPASPSAAAAGGGGAAGSPKASPAASSALPSSPSSAHLGTAAAAAAAGGPSSLASSSSPMKSPGSSATLPRAPSMSPGLARAPSMSPGLARAPSMASASPSRELAGPGVGSAAAASSAASASGSSDTTPIRSRTAASLASAASPSTPKMGAGGTPAAHAASSSRLPTTGGLARGAKHSQSFQVSPSSPAVSAVAAAAARMGEEDDSATPLRRRVLATAAAGALLSRSPTASNASSADMRRLARLG